MFSGNNEDGMNWTGILVVLPKQFVVSEVMILKGGEPIPGASPSGESFAASEPVQQEGDLMCSGSNALSNPWCDSRGSGKSTQKGWPADADNQTMDSPYDGTAALSAMELQFSKAGGG
jgi:hypothetical protein